MIGEFEFIRCKSVPLVVPRFAFAFRVLGKPGESVDIKLQLVKRRGGDVLHDSRMKGILGTNGAMVCVTVMDNVAFPDFGVHRFRLTVNGSIEDVFDLKLIKEKT